MMTPMEKAKEIFFQHYGSTYLMVRDEDGTYDVYKSFNVPKELEFQWRKEMRDDALNKFNQAINMKDRAMFFREYGDKVLVLEDIDGFNFMLEYVRQNVDYWDTWSILRFTDAVSNNIRLLPKERQKEVIKEMIEISKTVFNHPITVSEDYRENGVLPYSASEEKIIESLKYSIKYWEEELGLRVGSEVPKIKPDYEKAKVKEGPALTRLRAYLKNPPTDKK